MGLCEQNSMLGEWQAYLLTEPPPRFIQLVLQLPTAGSHFIGEFRSGITISRRRADCGEPLDFNRHVHQFVHG
jgi:hypothetical protein